MKQKNMLLVAVAVVCGLLAAVMTSQMGSAPAEVKQIPVLVALKDLPLNTKLEKEKIDEMVVYKPYTEQSVPQQPFVNTKEELVGKTLTRAMRKDDFFVASDLTDKVTLELPKGMSMVTIPISRDQLVGGFAVPGSRVDILASMVLPQSGKQYVFPLLKNMLVLAVDVSSTPTPERVMLAVSNVSLAVTKDDATILHSAMSRGVAMRVLLLGDNIEEKYPDAANITRDQVRQLLAGEYDPYVKAEGDSNLPPPPPAQDVVELPVPTEDLPAGTKLTEELIEKAFTMQKILPPAPANVIKDIRGQIGRFTQKDIAANQYVPRTFLADEAPKKPEQVAALPPKEGKAAPSEDGAAPKTAPDLPVAAAPPKKAIPKFHVVTIQTATGAKKYQYQILDGGAYKFIGEVKVEEAVTDEPAKSDADPKPAPKPAPAPGDKL